MIQSPFLFLDDLIDPTVSIKAHTARYHVMIEDAIIVTQTDI